MPLTDDERAELEALRLDRADRLNPNVRLIEGELTFGDGEYSARGVRTPTGHIYLVEMIEDLLDYSRDAISFAWHISSEPLSFHQLEEHLVKTAMGLAQTEFHHAYSDLTGYLWTTENLKVGGHDVLNEIESTIRTMSRPVYIALRVERKPQ